MQAYSDRLVGAIPLSDHSELRVIVHFENGRPRAVNLRPFERTEAGALEAERNSNWREMSPGELPLMSNRSKLIAIPLDQLDRFQELVRKAQSLVFQLSTADPYAKD
jgi:hypothetical protein